MKILFVNLPYHGHVVPTIGLVRELIQMGCRVSYLMPYGWETRIAESGAAFCGYQNHRQLAEQIKNAYAAADRILDDFDLLVYEQFFFLGKALAEKHGKPAVRIFTAPATNKALMEQFTAKGPMASFRHKWLSSAFTRDIAKDIPLKTDNWLDEIIENPPELNLVYTLRQFQPYAEAFPPDRFLFLGPSVYPRQEAPFSFEKKRPVIYISLGTVLKGSRSFYQACFDAFGSEDVDVILSTKQKFNAKKVPANFHVFPSVPQVQVLELADVFVTHGGMNSVMESLTAGTPMVVVPFVSDQPVNARQVESMGAGHKLSPANIRKEQLKNAVFSLLSDNDTKNTMSEIRQTVRSSPGNKGGAAAIMEYYDETDQTNLF